MASERQIRKEFRNGDLVEVSVWDLNTEKFYRKQGTLDSLLSVQFFVDWNDELGGGAFYFYKDGHHMSLIERDGKPPKPPRKRRTRKKSVEEAGETPLETAMKKTPAKRKPKAKVKKKAKSTPRKKKAS